MALEGLEAQLEGVRSGDVRHGDALVEVVAVVLLLRVAGQAARQTAPAVPGRQLVHREGAGAGIRGLAAAGDLVQILGRHLDEAHVLAEERGADLQQQAAGGRVVPRGLVQHLRTVDEVVGGLGRAERAGGRRLVAVAGVLQYTGWHPGH